MTKANLSQ